MTTFSVRSHIILHAGFTDSQREGTYITEKRHRPNFRSWLYINNNIMQNIQHLRKMNVFMKELMFCIIIN